MQNRLLEMKKVTCTFPSSVSVTSSSQALEAKKKLGEGARLKESHSHSQQHRKSKWDVAGGGGVRPSTLRPYLSPFPLLFPCPVLAPFPLLAPLQLLLSQVPKSAGPVISAYGSLNKKK